jgi:hypothetical protein
MFKYSSFMSASIICVAFTVTFLLSHIINNSTYTAQTNTLNKIVNNAVPLTTSHITVADNDTSLNTTHATIKTAHYNSYIITDANEFPVQDDTNTNYPTQPNNDYTYSNHNLSAELHHYGNNSRTAAQRSNAYNQQPY